MGSNLLTHDFLKDSQCHLKCSDTEGGEGKYRERTSFPLRCFFDEEEKGTDDKHDTDDD